jgi:outer membrane protein
MSKIKYISVFLAAALLAPGGAAQAAQGDILARLRAVYVKPDLSTRGPISGMGMSMDAIVTPELDFTYMFTDRIGAELILGWPGLMRTKVKSNGASLGKVSMAPPTLTLQYHFNPSGKLRPYVGAGLNYTLFVDNGVKYQGQPIHAKRHSIGPALQLGMDIGIDENWFFNVDVKKIWMKTDTSVAGMPMGRAHVDPWLFGVGVGRRF